MSRLMVKGNFSDGPKIPADVHHGICYAVIDIGEHWNQRWEKFQQKIVVVFELPGERMRLDDGRDLPRAISRTFNFSWGKKSHLRAFIGQWRGKPITDEELRTVGFDPEVCVGWNGMLNVTHETRETGTFANIAGIMPLPRGMQPRRPENPAYFYQLGDPFPKSMPQWLIDKIQTCRENSPDDFQIGLTTAPGGKPAPEDIADGIPF